MKWHIHHTLTVPNGKARRQAIIKQLLQDRGIPLGSTDTFFHPPSPFSYQAQDVGIDPLALDSARHRINKAIRQDQPILIYGDYDADGITATAILWEALTTIKAQAFPFIPNREIHGYGLSVKGIKDALSSPQLQQSNTRPLVITVDNGITAHPAAQYLHRQQLDLIITDHHQPGQQLPLHHSLVHTDTLSGSGIAWFLAKSLSRSAATASLDLAAIGTIADMLPLIGVNRSLAKFGLKDLESSPRPGIQALINEAGIEPSTGLSTYHVNYVIAPRLNAMGRLEDALDSLRLICTRKQDRAAKLAATLGDTNRRRQDLTHLLTQKALGITQDHSHNLIIVEDEEFHEGIIGLIAGKLVEKYYKPAIVIAKNPQVSKASARSVSGVNIIELIRTQEELLVNAGGHPMAAGFSIETANISRFAQNLLQHAAAIIDTKLLQPTLNIDCLLEETDINDHLFQDIEQFKPFGIGNPRPVFALTGCRLLHVQQVGKTGDHLKVLIKTKKAPLEGIGFNLGRHFDQLHQQSTVDLAFTLDENIWNGRRSLQLKLKDIRT